MWAMLTIMVRGAHAQGKKVWAIGDGPMADTFRIGTPAEFEKDKTKYGAKEVTL